MLPLAVSQEDIGQDTVSSGISPPNLSKSN